MPLPVGRVARHRRILRRALADGPVGRVLVVGPWRAARQAFPHAPMDVAGTSPHTRQVTVCSEVRSTAGLPANRWDTVVVSDPVHVSDRLAAVHPACRPRARVVLLEPAASSSGIRDDAVERATPEPSVVSRRDRVRVWRLP
jgi:hypothetical protein